MSIIEEIAAERERQKSLGFTEKKDDSYESNDLALAAASYAVADDHGLVNIIWPWQMEWWKPRTPRRNLIKAGALIVAEIERLDRAKGRR